MSDQQLSPTEQAALLDERYGRTPAAVRRRWLLLLGAIGLSIMVGWALWVALGVARQPLAWQTVGYHVLNPTATDVTFELTFIKHPQSGSAFCTIQAQNAGHQEVGRRDVEVPATAHTVRTTSQVHTSELAVTGLVEDCAPSTDR